MTNIAEETERLDAFITEVLGADVLATLKGRPETTLERLQALETEINQPNPDRDKLRDFGLNDAQVETVLDYIPVKQADAMGAEQAASAEPDPVLTEHDLAVARFPDFDLSVLNGYRQAQPEKYDALLQELRRQADSGIPNLLKFNDYGLDNSQKALISLMVSAPENYPPNAGLAKGNGLQLVGGMGHGLIAGIGPLF